MSESQASLDSIVSDYLKRHPDFLIDHPDVLESLHVKHASGQSVSLIERQVAQLRRKNQELTRQLGRLMRMASENEQLMSRLHQLTLELMARDEPRRFFNHLGKSLRDDFKADLLQIILFNPELSELAGDSVRWADFESEALKQFHGHLQKGHTVCGRLNVSKLSFLFETKSQWVQSTALVPLGAAGEFGMMAIGSSDPARFYPGMGTLFLDLLADVIASSLSNAQPEAQRRSA